ncbi:family 65 glycosyl hydrolase domain-containing protein [Sphingobacterium hotanense]|uniref:family 65 glycosyl hydrolase domain-containing protein n=1 Tax=Sphingobacterium hotanense TaxID=649196 RepID=UPI0021A5E0E7|nr:family 65 glycosyl hydrolase domain-containing protein [Sphingobacterium hotanense]MCT1525645.1 family 65 glycosyl hydrolase domain-containing protein [Sphingobacterium hotanense]
MKNYIQADPWNIIEEGFDPHLNKISESLFSIGNGKMGQRANFEETYSGESLQGSYVAGIYFPDKTRVGWWKNGYPPTFDKVINSTNWIGIDIYINNVLLDLAQCQVTQFKRVLNMQEGYLQRTFRATINEGQEIEVNSIRFCSIADDEIGAIQYSLTALNFDAAIKIVSKLDGDIVNEDSNYDFKFWEPVTDRQSENGVFLQTKTLKTGFELCVGAKTQIYADGHLVKLNQQGVLQQNKWIAEEFHLDIASGNTINIIKLACVQSSLNHPAEALLATCEEKLAIANTVGFEKLKETQKVAWANKWLQSDIQIEGDVKAQQAIRFNIFQLFQTYTGTDSRLNIGPKGFTGEKYAGATYWDTEAYCIPFYLSTAPQEVGRNLLVYRYNHLEKAIENAEMLGFKNGAALYPMVTMDGTESHNEWEITFEEIHRNGAIAYAIYNYINYTQDRDYLAQYGLEVLVAIARFWAQRVNWSEEREKYVMLGVTGPNEYENNVNNNWYTNYLAVWCLNYTREALDYVKQQDVARFEAILDKISFDLEELELWQEIANNMYYPYHEKLKIYLQQDGYLDKEQWLVKDLPASERPLNQKWSWDRILRSCFIKQADVLQGMYFFEDQFDLEDIRRNFDFYEPRTVHESSLSPCIHSILAAKLNDEARAYEFYLRTARLDLDDYNNDTEDGLHITSMAGTWMSIVQGFAGMRIKNNQLYFQPFLPEQWESFTFNIGFRGKILSIRISKGEMEIENTSSEVLDVQVGDANYSIPGNSSQIINI